MLRGRGQNANTYHISLELSYYDNSTVLRSGEELLPSVGESALKVAIFRTLPLKLRTPDDRLTLPELRQKRREARLNRAQEYQQLIDDNGWTRAELTRHLGVSLAWVTIVLKNVVGVDSRT
ncbi:hypothetical protein HQ531_03845 [bacterium]|nr:hypothetical protein [bacterium]